MSNVTVTVRRKRSINAQVIGAPFPIVVRVFYSPCGVLFNVHRTVTTTLSEKVEAVEEITVQVRRGNSTKVTSVE